MTNATLSDPPLDSDTLRDIDALLDDESRAAMTLLKLVTTTALAIGLLGLGVRLLG
jgi:hypothetical protein